MDSVNRYDWVNYAKAIGIALVVYGHVVRGAMNAGLTFDSAIYELLDKFVYSFHMPLFFFLSGLFFWNSFAKRCIFEFVGNKIDTIVYIYIVWSLLQGLSEVALSEYTNGSATLSEVLALFWIPRQQFWFLYALFLILILHALIFQACGRKIAILLPLFLASLWLTVFKETISFGSFYVTWIVLYSPYFLLGALTTKYNILRHFVTQNRLLLGPTSVLALICIGSHYVNLANIGFADVPLWQPAQNGLSLIVATSTIVLICVASSALATQKINWLLFLGTASMAVFVMHTFATAGTRVLLTKLLNIDNTPIHILLGTTFGLVFPCIAYYMIHRFNIGWMLSTPYSFERKISSRRG